MLVWIGDGAAPTPPTTPSPQPSQAPASYTPQHLAERILAEQSAIESRGSTDGERKTITNLAARMKQLATPGSIVISEYTRRLTESYFELKVLGAADIKGVEEPRWSEISLEWPRRASAPRRVKTPLKYPAISLPPLSLV